ncbi:MULTISPECIES: adenosylmethionine--8-amino-7-oxononanoate transaminase [Nocardiopsis]|uniref:Adenosylmethionine-8-amino-7-oxononanoate aminotransferase n=1 Tax=Nocardiopsis sinuspersici TaxID=501010 RepID=A0A1V3BX09_9ACTN|nr:MULTISPECIES: adenosylmethionine--8-amino-7-oxononanoate transaminase [Nocardiopsis]NYH54073.1 adenosylmethionine-8-amino-7-oxononanoate aminotransferase [Nocardiopsis sinuspersici]OOC52912.1 adenosylmethionine--8-amino-7-oxononanoate transaminase [Nocardiopsis sinuspersici]
MNSTPTGTARFLPERVRAADTAHLWHPYAAVPGAERPYVVTGAGGTRLSLWSEEGTYHVVDGMSSWWSAIHGYRHPVLDAAVRGQVDSYSHVMFGGLTHGPAAELAETLVALTPEPLEHVFLADSGSVSVEVAMKMCLQYHRSTGSPGRRRFLTWRGGYHGDTFHAMSVCDPSGGMHSLWGDVLPAQVHAPEPPAGFDTEPDPLYVDAFERLAAEHAGELAAIIVEPVVQGAGGMRFHHPGYLRELRRIADAYGLLLVFDEIATGFGRTGELFAADHAGVAPDVMCLGKALTGGYLTLAATLCTGRVARGIAGGEVPVLAHGPTFMGNPLACATALASVELLTRGDWRGDVARIEAGLREGLAPAERLPGVREVRVLGAVGVVELEAPVRMGEATRAAVEAGVWLRPFRDHVYAMPPYVCGPEDVAVIAAGMVAAARASLGEGPR